jgi:hypothetical protein
VLHLGSFQACNDAKNGMKNDVEKVDLRMIIYVFLTLKTSYEPSKSDNPEHNSVLSLKWFDNRRSSPPNSLILFLFTSSDASNAFFAILLLAYEQQQADD